MIEGLNSIVTFVNTYVGFVLILLSFISAIFGIMFQDKYDISNRFRKRIAIIRNKNANARMVFTYKTKKEFEIVKDEILNSFETPIAHQNNDNKLIFNNKYYSFCVFNEPEGDIYIEVERIDASIQGLREKIKVLIDKIDSLVDKGIINNLVSCKLEIELPFRWRMIHFRKPKGFDLNEIDVVLRDIENHTLVKISMDKSVTINFDKITIVEDVVKKLLY